ncbi:MAG: NAD(+)/NADH kinase [Eubacteriaceae bacterium]|nr:NAD(+)/NADH kinase [Eubacteriaceae bacterium]
MYNIAVLANEMKPSNIVLARHICEYLALRGCKSAVRGILTESLDFGGLSWDNVVSCEACIVIGGDGTLLRAHKLVSPHGVPLLGINTGTMGFLADVEPDCWRQRLSTLLSGDFYIEERAMVRAMIGGKEYDALNDISIKHFNEAGVGIFKVYSGNELIAHYSADGVLVVAPTGSTAYSLSAGGPIVNPACKVMIIQPLNPHSFNNRAVIVDLSEEIRVSFDIDKTLVSVDGQRVRAEGIDIVSVRESPEKARFIKFSDYSFYKLLFEKIKNNQIV